MTPSDKLHRCDLFERLVRKRRGYGVTRFCVAQQNFDTEVRNCRTQHGSVILGPGTNFSRPCRTGPIPHQTSCAVAHVVARVRRWIRWRLTSIDPSRSSDEYWHQEKSQRLPRKLNTAKDTHAKLSRIKVSPLADQNTWLLISEGNSAHTHFPSAWFVL